MTEPKQTSMITKEDDEKNNIIGGIDANRLRAMIKLRKMNVADRDEQEYLIETYRKALGM